jgi:hypothetical protein
MTAMPAGDSPFDADGHPSVEAISECTEGVLRPDHADAVRAHLASCDPCSETHEALGEIRELLGRTPHPRLSADVSGRIDAALAAESLLAAELPDITPEELAALEGDASDSAVARLIAEAEARAAEESRLPVDPEWTRALLESGLPAPERPAPQPPSPDEETSAADLSPEPWAEASPSADASYGEAPNTEESRPGQTTGPRAHTGPAPTAPRDGRPPRSPRRVRRTRVGVLAGAGLAVAAAVTGVVVSNLQAPASSGNSASAGAHGSTPPSSTGGLATLTAAGLPGEVRQMLAATAPSNGAMQPHTAAGDGSGNGSSPTPPTTAPGCVTSATGRTGTPLAVEPASYRDGSGGGSSLPVYVVVYPAASPSAVDAYVVPSSCSGGVLLHRRLTRP